MTPARGGAARNGDGPTELDRLLEEAVRCIEALDLTGANAALRKAHAEAASPRDDADTGEEAVPGGRATAGDSGDRG